MRTEIKKIIDEWDPFNLKPNNFYGPESFEILKCIISSRTRDPEVISEYIRRVLGWYCPPNSFTSSSSECLNIAYKILAILD